jgi:hypothetical protein
MKIVAWVMSVALVAIGCSAAQADQWTASKLRGGVFIARGQQWVPLTRGEVVEDGRTVHTMANGYVEFDRGDETISLAANTEAQVVAQQGGRYTVVSQYFGEVSVQDDHTALPHLEVDTPYIAAVVKGTRFTVRSDQKLSRVDVSEGEVQVRDANTLFSVTIFANQHAGAGLAQPLFAGGSGRISSITNQIGQVVSTQNASRHAESTGASEDNSSSDGKSDNGKGNGGVPGNGGSNGNSDNAGKSDNGNGNGGQPGNGGSNSNGNSGNGNSGGSNSKGNSGNGNGDD